MLKRILTVIMVCIMALPILPASDTTVSADNALTGRTSNEIVSMMGLGWNLGNTLDATGGNRSDVTSQETSWGNPVVTRELIHAVKEAGFSTIRIPVTWYKHIDDDGAYTIDEEFMNRVKTIVDYAIGEGLFVILNLHHEAWVNDSKLSTRYEAIGKELAAVWMQIADAFAEYDQRLIFEGMNEPRMAGTDLEWSGNEEGCAAINYLNQIFTNVIRSSGKGYNNERCLMIPGYAASDSYKVMDAISLPTYNGAVVKNLIISVHCYSPNAFCLNDTMKDFDTSDSACVGEIDTIFSDIQKVFLDNGIPVVIGETSATAKNNTAAREKWAYYMGAKSAAYGVPLVIWDNGNNSNSGGESHAYFNRGSNTLNYPTIIQKLLEGVKSCAWGSGRDDNGTVDTGDGKNIIWQNEVGLTSTSTWDSSYICMSAQRSFFGPGRDITVTYTGNGEPKLILDSDTKKVWWIPVEPSYRGEKNGKKTCSFSYEDILAAMKANGVDNFSDLRNFMILAANDNITTYEIEVVGGTPAVTFKANGKDYAVSSALPANPTFKNMKFEGWYFTKDFKAGTEYTGAAVTSDTTVYAKYSLTLNLSALKKEFEAIRNGEEPSGEDGTTTSDNTETTADDSRETTVDDSMETTGDNKDTTVDDGNETSEDQSGNNITETHENPDNGKASATPWILAAAGALLAVLSAVIIIVVIKKKKTTQDKK